MTLIIVQIIILTLAILIGCYLLPGISIKSVGSAFLVAIVLALLNAFVKPFMVWITIPFTFLTFGLFLFVINALIILLAGVIVKGFKVNGFWWALLFSIIISVIQYLLEFLIFPEYFQT